MPTCTTSFLDDCQLFHTFNYDNDIDVNNFSVAQSFFTKFNDEFLDTINTSINNFMVMIKEVENTEYTLDECKQILPDFIKLSKSIEVTIKFLDLYKLDSNIAKTLLKKVNKLYKLNGVLIEKFEDYIDVLEARQNIAEGNFITLDSAFSV